MPIEFHLSKLILLPKWLISIVLIGVFHSEALLVETWIDKIISTTIDREKQAFNIAKILSKLAIDCCLFYEKNILVF